MSWQDWIFGNLPPQPARPTSQGAMLGMNYGVAPTSSRIDDRRQEPFDYAYFMREAGQDDGDGPGPDPIALANSNLRVSTGASGNIAPYKPSFQPNWRPQPLHQAPYQAFPFGPNLPRDRSTFDPAYNSNFDPDYLPDIGAHLPWSPGDPDWTPPPSPSGPHNPRGDQPRPGYGDIVSNPQNVISPQQIQNALQYWQGGAQ